MTIKIFQTLKAAVTNYGLTNKDVTTFGLSIFGVVVVNNSYVEHMKSKGTQSTNFSDGTFSIVS